MAKRVKYVVFIRRGDMRVAFPTTSFGLMETPGQVAMSAAVAMAKLMVAYPGREGALPFSPLEGSTILLRLDGEKKPLDPSLSLKRQLEGRWKPLDQEALEGLGIHELTEDIRHGEVYVMLELFEMYGSLN
jgi:hypothetical protein